MQTEDLPPDPSALVESLRAFGYSLEGAVADLVDNSITANASRISVEIRWNNGCPYVQVVDDGDGMSEAELRTAMRLGSRSPRETRAEGDLGRFGLGLKTAAFSQGRTLTVASRAQGSSIEVCQWDLDLIEERSAWTLQVAPPLDGWDPERSLASHESGTLVRVDSLDRLSGKANTGEASEDEFLRYVATVEAHLAMVFHRLLGPRRVVTVNGNEISPWDPFVASQRVQSERLPGDPVAIDQHAIDVRAYVLPHHSRLSREEHQRAAGPRGWNAHQGFYIYRERRLLLAGGWLDLGIQQEEHCKLARIRVDLPNSLDELWQIDVRKATAQVPAILRPTFTRIAKAARKRASEVYRFRGKVAARATSNSVAFAWEIKRGRDRTQFKINRQHPVVADALSATPTGQRQLVKDMLTVIESTIPREAIFAVALEAEAEAAPPDTPPAAVERQAKRMLAELTSNGVSREAAVEQIVAIEPFDSYLALIGVLLEIDQDG